MMKCRPAQETMVARREVKRTTGRRPGIVKRRRGLARSAGVRRVFFSEVRELQRRRYGVMMHLESVEVEGGRTA
jgi:hypothetical protein